MLIPCCQQQPRRWRTLKFLFIAYLSLERQQQQQQHKQTNKQTKKEQDHLVNICSENPDLNDSGFYSSDELREHFEERPENDQGATEDWGE